MCSVCEAQRNECCVPELCVWSPSGQGESDVDDRLTNKEWGPHWCEAGVRHPLVSVHFFCTQLELCFHCCGELVVFPQDRCHPAGLYQAVPCRHVSGLWCHQSVSLQCTVYSGCSSCLEFICDSLRGRAEPSVCNVHWVACGLWSLDADASTRCLFSLSQSHVGAALVFGLVHVMCDASGLCWGVPSTLSHCHFLKKILRDRGKRTHGHGR